MKKIIVFFCIIIAFMCGILFYEVKKSVTPKVDEYYYLEAEILTQDSEQITFTTPNGNYQIVNHEPLDENIYLLTMSSNNTSDTKDDEIIVVWADCN